VSGLAISSTDVWAFGSYTVGNSTPLGAWHYNGAGWQRTSPVALLGATALSPDDIWAFNATSVARWNGHAWRYTAMSRWLPPDTQTCHSGITALYAQSETSVWAAASGWCEPSRGPFELLHFNGSSWAPVARSDRLGTAVAITPDGGEGLWIPITTGFPGVGSMWHFGKGKMTKATPSSSDRLTITGASIGQNTTQVFAVGVEYHALDVTSMKALIFEYKS
jgi:hypothetical protein